MRNPKCPKFCLTSVGSNGRESYSTIYVMPVPMTENKHADIYNHHTVYFQHVKISFLDQMYSIALTRVVSAHVLDYLQYDV
jgi:hypothetical protein